MDNHMVVTLEKPMPHLTLADWRSRVQQLSNIANARRDDAFDIRQSSRKLRNDTNITERWSIVETNEALEDRIAEISKWRVIISQTVARIDRETKLLRIEKDAAEKDLDSLQFPIAVIAECLTMRDCRLGSELTYDDADTEIKNELAVIENNQIQLAKQCEMAWQKLNRLEDVRFKMDMEIGNKMEAEELDRTQLALEKTSANISFKTDPLRNPKNSCSYEQWLEHVKNMKQLAENELADTYAIREALFVCREKAFNMMRSQQERAEHAIRKRIFETQKARNELEWQKLKMQEAMEAALCEVKRLEQDMRNKTDGIKLAETRLENRAQRSGMELCTDNAHDQLINEVQILRANRQRLIDKIDEAKANFNLLEEHALKIDIDLENKQHSLMTDIRALDLRARLKPQSKGGFTAQTERNIALTHMEDEIPKE